MRKIKKCIFIVFVVMTSVFVNMIVYADDEILASEFEDEKFYNFVIENYDSNGDGVLMESEAQAVDYISIPTEVTSLKGIEYFVGLENLYMIDNDLITSDKFFGYIIKLKNLNYLDIYHCEGLTDFSMLNNFTWMSSLSISGTNVSDISFLYYMPELVNLSIFDCPNITDFSPVSSCKSLYSFSARDNLNFTDISIIEATDIVQLDLHGCTNIVDFSILSRFEKIEDLMISGNTLTDFSFLEKYSSLRYLDITDAVNIMDITALKYCTALEGLNIYDSCLSDLAQLCEARTMYVLRLDNCNITDISFIVDMANIQYLYLNRNKSMTELPDMTGMSKLQSVYANSTGITVDEASKKLASGVTFVKDEVSYVIEHNPDGGTSENTSDSNDDDEDNTTEDDSTKILTSILDEDIQAEGKFDEETYLEGERIYNTSPYKDIITKLYDTVDNVREVRVYDISLYKDITENETTVKVKVQPDDSVKVSIRTRDLMSGAGCKVYRQEDDGSLTELECYIAGQTVLFYSDHFSIFTLVITKFLGEDSSYEDEYIYADDGVGGDNTVKINDLDDNNIREDDTTSQHIIKDDENIIDNKEEIDFSKNEKVSNENNDTSQTNSEKSSNKEKSKNTTTKVVIVAIVVSVIVLDIVAYEVYAWEGKKKLAGETKD